MRTSITTSFFLLFLFGISDSCFLIPFLHTTTVSTPAGNRTRREADPKREKFFLIPFWHTTPVTTPAGNRTRRETDTKSEKFFLVPFWHTTPVTTPAANRTRRETDTKSEKFFLVPFWRTTPVTTPAANRAARQTDTKITARKPGDCPKIFVMNPWCPVCSEDSQCPGIQKCCPDSGKKCCFAVLLTG
uniref:WAP domain-containing protein n=1 Tax=Strigamia maritima TaxID=126957 RepID=T1J306_STRMM